MGRINPAAREDIPELSDLFSNLETQFGFLPNDMMTMARKPQVLTAFTGLARAINDPSGTVPLALKFCVSYISARTVGCQYCQAHTASIASELGVADEKVAAIWEFETNPLFDDAERAALSFAQAAASTPNMVADEDFAKIRAHFTDEQILEILLVVCLSAFFTRWNETLTTTLEKHASDFAAEHLVGSGWTIGNHAPD